MFTPSNFRNSAPAFTAIAFLLYDSEELSKENLLSNFTLKGKPSAIDFGHLDDDLAQVDLKTAIPRHRVSPS